MAEAKEQEAVAEALRLISEQLASTARVMLTLVEIADIDPVRKGLIDSEAKNGLRERFEKINVYLKALGVDLLKGADIGKSKQ